MEVITKKKVAVALSGGVDSSVCALLLKQQGYNVIGITGKMTNSPATDLIVQNAKAVADKLGIEHHVFDVHESFKQNVIDYFNQGYINAQTPNPCAACNKFIKWGILFNYAINELQADFFSTGHYANIKKVGDYFKLYPAKDPRKDQLYFLFSLSQENLSKTLFPLFEYEKFEIRQIAIDNDLPSKSSKESQDICFIEKPKILKTYLKESLGVKRGYFRHIETNKVLGEHDGYYQYTIGQRKGIGIAYPTPLYVIKLDSETNTVYVGEKPLASGKELKLRSVSFSYPQDKSSFDVMTKIRYNMPFVKAHVEITETGAKMNFYEPVYSITPGQAAVWYDLNDGHLLGGGWII